MSLCLLWSLNSISLKSTTACIPSFGLSANKVTSLIATTILLISHRIHSHPAIHPMTSILIHTHPYISCTIPLIPPYTRNPCEMNHMHIVM